MKRLIIVLAGALTACGSDDSPTALEEDHVRCPPREKCIVVGLFSQGEDRDNIYAGWSVKKEPEVGGKEQNCQPARHERKSTKSDYAYYRCPPRESETIYHVWATHKPTGCDTQTYIVRPSEPEISINGPADTTDCRSRH